MFTRAICDKKIFLSAMVWRMLRSNYGKLERKTNGNRHGGIFDVWAYPRLLRENDLLIGLALMARTDLNNDFLIEPFEKIQQFVGGEATEMPVH